MLCAWCTCEWIWLLITTSAAQLNLHQLMPLKNCVELFVVITWIGMEMQDGENLIRLSNIVFPAGTKTVTVRQIPHLLSLIHHPIDYSSEFDDTQCIHRILKRRIPPGNDGRALGQLEPLDEEDWDVLFNLWKALPPYRDGLTASQWQPYAEVFEQECPWPEYELSPVWDDIHDLRAEAKKLYSSLLQDAIDKGFITPLSARGIPIANATGEVLMSAEVSVDELEKFVRSCYGTLESHPTELLATDPPVDDEKDETVGQEKDTSQPHSHPQGSWKAQAYEIGKAWMLDEEERTGNRPGQIAIAKYVEGELSNRGIKGPRVTYLDQETIRREALKGITGRPQNGK